VKSIRIFSILLAILVSVYQTNATTIFPIATNANIIEYSGGIASSGSNYLVGFFQNQTNPCVQLIATNGALLGSLTNIGESEGAPLVAFGTTNYLAFWAGDGDSNGVDVYAQLVSANGTATGPAFPLLTNIGSLGGQTESSIAFDGTNFLVAWIRNNGNGPTGDASFYGQFVSQAGTLLGSEFLIGNLMTNEQSNNHAALVFGATNYLFAWEVATNLPPEEWETYGTFISRTGLVATPFQISQTASLDHNPPAAAFDGTNFFVIMNTDTAQTASGVPIWNLYGRLVSQAGTFPGSELLLNTNQAVVGSVAFDGVNYLLGWGYDTFTTNTDKSAFCQFYNRSANPIGPTFVPVPPQGTNYPVSAGIIFDGSKFVIAGTLGNLILSTNGSIEGLASGAVYGAFIPASTTPPTLTPTAPPVGAQFPLQLTGTPGINYAIQFSTNLALNNWTAVVTNSPTNGIFSFTDSTATDAFRFYRAMKQ
jgi:hypothetical protein